MDKDTIGAVALSTVTLAAVAFGSPVVAKELEHSAVNETRSLAESAAISISDIEKATFRIAANCTDPEHNDTDIGTSHNHHHHTDCNRAGAIASAGHGARFDV